MYCLVVLDCSEIIMDVTSDFVKMSLGGNGKLNGDNYHSWKFNAKMFLMGKDLWGYVDGTEKLKLDASENEKKQFHKLDNQALSFICLSVETNVQIYVRNSKSAKEAWDSLSAHFEEKTLSKKIFYRRQLYSARMSSASSMEVHLNNIKTIAEHLEALDDAVDEKDLVMILISSLPDSYNNLITTLETLDEKQLTWAYIRDRVTAEYERKKGGDRNNSRNGALLSAGERYSKDRDKKKSARKSDGMPLLSSEGAFPSRLSKVEK